jgi:hypothetical protein
MWHTTNTGLIKSVWNSVNQTETRNHSRDLADLVSKILRKEKEWVDIEDVKDLIFLMDGRFADSKIREFANSFDIPLRTIYSPPLHGQKEVWGSYGFAVADVAALLIQLERIGFKGDPSLLCDPLKERLRDKIQITDSELLVYWYQRNRHRQAPMTLIVDPKAIGTKTSSFCTSENYLIELWTDQAGNPTMLEASPPKRRKHH